MGVYVSATIFAKKFNEKLCQMLDEFNQKVEQRTLPDAPGSKPVFGKSKEVRYEFPYEFLYGFLREFLHALLHGILHEILHEFLHEFLHELLHELSLIHI